MLKNIYIENFKCFESENVAFKNLTVLTGENGSGKSTVIQSFLLLKQSHDIHNHKIQEMKKLYLNDYYCELGSYKDILYCESSAKDDKIIFAFTNSDDSEQILECIPDKNTNANANKNIMNIEHSIPNEKEKINHNADLFIYDFDFISADRFGPKTFYHVDANFSTLKVGKLGEYTGIIISSLQEDLTFLSELNDALSSIFGFINIKANHIDSANISVIEITNSKTKSLGYKSPVNMPYGVSYVLPILVSCLIRHPNRKNDIKSPTVVVENPEAHLHPAAQSKLGIFLSKMAEDGIQIVLETHSDHIINGIRIAIRKKIISQDNVLFNFFEKGDEVGQNTIRNISADENGTLSDWPKGFFDQYENDLMDLI
jgi:predicted ATPase